MVDWNRFNSWKVLKYSDRLQDIADDKIPFPVVFHVYPTNKCNMSCSFCIMKEEKLKHPVELPYEILRKAVDDAITHKMEFVNFTGGGEPFLNKALPKVLKYADNRLRIGVLTNGVHFNPDLIDYISHLRISVNASKEETHRKIMGSKQGAFTKIIHNTIYALSFREYSNDFYHDVGWAFLITPDNWTEVYDFAKLAADVGVDFVHYRPCFYPKESPLNDEMMDIVTNKLKPLREAVEKDFKNIMQVGFVTEKFEGYWSKRDFSRCRSTPLQAVLTATGEFIVCQDVFIRFGDYYKQSFEDIWLGEEHKKAMDLIDLDACPRCVETRHNQIIEHMFIKNDVRCELL